MEDNKTLEFLARLDQSRRRLTGEEMEFLYRLAQHPNPLIRGDVAALLIDHYEEKSEQVLLQLTYDPNPFVRADAVDSLCIGRKEQTLQRLVFLAEHDPEYTVRGGAVHSIYDLCVNRMGDSDRTHQMVRQILQPLLQRESACWAQTCYYCILYLCGDRQYLPFLLERLDDEDDYIRNSVLEAFEDILDENNEGEIEDALQYHLSFEHSESLVDKISNLLLMIQDHEMDYSEEPL